MTTKTIQEVIEQLNDYMEVSTTLAFTSRKKYGKIIRLFLLSHGLKFTIHDINKFITERNKKRDCYNYKYAFQYFLTSIGKKELYDQVKGVKKKPRKKVFKHIPKDTVQKMLNMMPAKYRYMALIQYKTGCRFIEAATIRAENIDFNLSPDLIYITLGGGLTKVKGNKGRKVRMPNKYGIYLKQFMLRPYGYLFLDPKFENYDEQRFFNAIETYKRYYNEELTKVGNYYGFEGFSSHYLRHLFADEYMSHKGTIESLKLVMGHANIDTTLQYVSVGEEAADRTIKAMD